MDEREAWAVAATEGLKRRVMDESFWRHVSRFDNHLDQHTSEEHKAQPLGQDWARISKVIEELGEAIEAFIGVTGQNPRKGITHTINDVLNELADTALTAIYAIQHFTKDTDQTRLYIHGRAAIHGIRVGIPYELIHEVEERIKNGD